MVLNENEMFVFKYDNTTLYSNSVAAAARKCTEIGIKCRLCFVSTDLSVYWDVTQTPNSVLVCKL